MEVNRKITLNQIEAEIEFRNKIIKEYTDKFDGIVNSAQAEIEYLELLKAFYKN